MRNKCLKTINSLLIAFVVLFGSITSVFAAGTCSMTVSGNNTVTTGSNITLTINVTNITGTSDGKVYGAGGYIQYNTEYLQMVESAYAPQGGWSGTMVNKGSGKYKFVSYNMGSGGISGAVAKVTFKALKAGETTVSLSEPDVSDGDENSLNCTAGTKSITIQDPAPVLDSNSKLGSLSVEGQTLSPSFSANTTSYTVTVPEDTTSVKVNATAASSKATLSGANQNVTLSGDSTTHTVKCTAENGTSTSYTVTIKKQKKADPTPEPEPEPAKKSSDSSLKYLSVSGYTLSPSFSSDTTTYSMTVGNGVTGLYVQATPNDPKATYDISGDDHWDVGKNVILIKVTAEDGSSTTYRVNVTRESAKVKSSDKNVDFRINNPHTITPAFSNDVNTYNVVVPYDVTKLDLSVVPYDKNASVRISGNEKFSTDENNVVKIVVTAEDGSTKTITLNVTRSQYKANTDLLDLKVKGYKMSPTFKPSTLKYSVTVPYKVRKVKVLVKAPEGATYKVTGYNNLQVGKNIVLVKVTDKKGFVKYYEIDVTRKEGFGKWIPFIIIFLLLLLLLLLLWLLHRRKKRKEEEKIVVKEAEKVEEEHEDNDPVSQNNPVTIDFKPEFNFGSKNGTDDDVINSQGGDILYGTDVKKLPNKEKPEGKVIDAEYDPYDDKVTKEELVDALNEGIRTKNVDKLQMLLDQENLNRKKEKMRRDAERANNEDDYEPHHSHDDYDE